MKKLSIILLAALLLCLAGCNKENTNADDNATKTKTTVCTYFFDGVDVENTIISTGEKVESISYQNTMVIEDARSLEMLKELLVDYKKLYDGKTGLTYEYTVEGNKVVEITTINYNTVNYEDLVEFDLIELEEGEIPTPLYVLYDDMIQQMQGLGCKCNTK